MVPSCASFLDALKGILIPKRSSRAWKTHLFEYHQTHHVDKGRSVEESWKQLLPQEHLSFSTTEALLVLWPQQLLLGTPGHLLREESAWL